VFTFKDNCFQANSKFSISTVLLTNLASESNFRHVELRIGLTSHCELLIVSLCFEERNWVALEMTGMIIVMNGTCRVVAMVDVSFFRVHPPLTYSLTRLTSRPIQTQGCQTCQPNIKNIISTRFQMQLSTRRRTWRNN